MRIIERILSLRISNSFFKSATLSDTGIKIVEYGLIVSVDEDAFDMNNYTYKIPSVIKLTDTGAYGVLLYNLPKTQTVYVKPYTIYESINNEFEGDGIQHIVYGRF